MTILRGFFSGLISMILLGGCSAYPDLSHLRKDPLVPQFSGTQGPGLHLKSSALETAGDYGMMVEWRLNGAGTAQLSEGLSLYRVHAGERVFLRRLGETQGTWWDTPLGSGRSYRYEIVDRSSQVVHAAEMVTDRDLIVEGEVRLPQDVSKIKRVFFKPGGTLVTSGLSFEWQLDELHGATGARILSFRPEHPAPFGDTARSSGEVSVKVQRASGPLKIEWRGETGSPGATGQAGASSQQVGANGSPGRWRGGGRRGESGDCSNGSDGSPGGPGGVGGIGGPAMNGGDAQDFEMRVATPLGGLEIETLIEAGRAGPGGAGGVGGSGGSGGTGGQAGGSECVSGSPGASGPAGPQGPQGPDGQPGERRGVACVFIGEQESCSNSRQSVQSPR